MLRKLIHKSSPANSGNDRLKAAKRNIYKQGALAVFTSLVTLVLVFAMTAAWYTNVVSTGNLVFQADSWGFEGDVTMLDPVIDAAPGDSGAVSMRISNTGKSVSAVSVNISKEFMAAELQKRIFFYADKLSVINGEQVQKQYLSNTNGFSYTLFPQNELILEEQIHTDVQLKWEWVYDVVGYYFRGSQDDTSFTVDEYLRPVEYDYDDARFDSEGNLTKVDKDTDVYTFLAKLTASDGYDGAYSVGQNEDGDSILLDAEGEEIVTQHGCYPIDEENDIWLYLCKKNDIEKNTDWDTEYGNQTDAEQRKFQARITVIGQQIAQQPVQISSESGLLAALTGSSGAVVQLEQDIVMTQPMELDGNVQAIVDLNGKQITYSGDTAFSLSSGTQLTMYNGTIAASGTQAKSTVFRSVGGQVTLSNVDITGAYRAFEINDHTTESELGDNSVIRITDSTLDTSNVSIMISGDGELSDRNTVLIIQDSTINSDYIAISGNGSSNRWGTDIQILNSKISGYYGAVYHPMQQSNLVVTDSELEGMTGIAIKGGTVTLVDTKITGTGQTGEVAEPSEEKLNGSGYQDTGDAVYVESDYGFAITVSISGSCELRHTAANAKPVRVFPEAEHVNMNITGGAFDQDVTEYLDEGYVCLLGEEFYEVVAEEAAP